MSKIMSWGDRFALIDHYNPSDEAICKAFKLSADELATARQLRIQGTFTANANLDCAKYSATFADVAQVPAATTTVHATPVQKQPTATVHGKPESASKKVKEPQKRGRKGDKIAKALLAVPSNPTSVDTFIKQHDISLAVLRQSKRFIEKLEPTVATSIGTVHVRQDKATKQLMIWRDATK
jgi:hypothetical protein